MEIRGNGRLGIVELAKKRGIKHTNVKSTTKRNCS
jgi:hypothetical protein